MVYFKDPQIYVQQSLLLLSARPNTTRITTTYGSPRRPKATQTDGSDSATTAASAAPRAILTLKTYDPISGATLKFRTDKASEVGRLMTGMRRCGHVMAAVPEPKSGESQEAPPTQDPEAEPGPKAKPLATPGQSQGKPGGKDKKKKGKR